ncbi:MAG: YdcF family protein [Lachnospiraceae bacterium]|nr:YdcF family protein [Lachnospiraceae bacterium]
MRKTLMHMTTLVFMVISIIIVYITCNVISICKYSNVYENKKCDVAIVLGAAANDTGVSEVYKQRLNHVVELYQEGDIDKIIVTGGKGNGNHFTDAYMAKKYLESMGIPTDSILEEDKSTITQENLENAQKIMEENGYKSALIVSDPLHMKRSMLLANDLGIEAFSSPTQSSAYKSIKTKIPFVARETFFYIGYKWYRVFHR